jgi:predicted phage-related endonuclease
MGAIENMQRICHDDLVQGSPEWIAFRAGHYGASEAAAMLGVSTKVKRNELLHAKKTGTPQEFSDWVQTNILDYGHEVERLARPLAEEIVGESLYPLTYSFGKLSASCDGLTMDGLTAFENKQWNKALVASIMAGELPEAYQPQCQQVMYVTGAERLLFVCSDGTRENMVHLWVYPNQAWVDAIVDGWAQFERDLETYIPAEVVPVAVAQPTEALPAVFVAVDGQLAVRDNLATFGDMLRAYINRLPKKPSTDQEFADAEAAVKKLGEAEDALKQAKSGALAQIDSVAKMTQAVDTLHELARSTRLSLEKLVKAEKENRRTAIIRAGVDALETHLRQLDAQLGIKVMPTIAADFGGAAKGLKTIASIQNAVDTTLANAKVEADRTAKRIAANLAAIREAGNDMLFHDVAQLVLKEPEFVTLTVRTRLDAHKAAEEKRLAEMREQAEREAREKLEREQAATAKAQEAASPAFVQDLPVQALSVAKDTTICNPCGPSPTSPQSSAPRHTATPSLRVGQIGDRLGFTVTVDFLRTLGFQPHGEGAARLYYEEDFPAMCDALTTHISRVRELHTKRAA